jgi:hypothetical protein
MLIDVHSISLPGPSRHVSEPAVNLGYTSFLDGLGGPGFVVEQIGDVAHDGKITDSAAEPDARRLGKACGLLHSAKVLGF